MPTDLRTLTGLRFLSGAEHLWQFPADDTGQEIQPPGAFGKFLARSYMNLTVAEPKHQRYTFTFAQKKRKTPG